MFRVRPADMRQQRRIAQMPAMRDLPASSQVLMKTGHAHSQYPALHTNRPEAPMAFDKDTPK